MNSKVTKFANITELLLYSIGVEDWLWELPKELMIVDNWAKDWQMNLSASKAWSDPCGTKIPNFVYTAMSSDLYPYGTGS